MLNGILVIDKDKGMTSADVVYHLRKALHIRKIGHAGTLDPDVTGVLPIAIGQATKLIELMHQRPKKYIGSGLLAYSTDSYDISGQTILAKPVEEEIPANTIQSAMNSFVGEITQVPPIYSAVKVNGKHLYEYARAGIQVERPKREVTVYQYDLLDQPNYVLENQSEDFSFIVKCSKGTYVRSLVNDLGEKLGQPAVMTGLRRIESSGFKIEQAVKLSKIVDHPELVENYLQPIDSFFTQYPIINLDEENWRKVQNGAIIQVKTDAKKLTLRYNNKVKAIYKKTKRGYQPDLMLLANQ